MVADSTYLDSSSRLDGFRGQIYSCTRCASCIAVCPTYRFTGEEALSARGRISLIEAVLDGRLGLTQGLSERLSRCLDCGACAEACPSGIDVPDAIRAARAELAGNGDRRLARGVARRLAGLSPALSQKLLHSCSTAYRALPGLPMVPWRKPGSIRHFPKTVSRPLDALIPEISPAAGATSSVAFFPGCMTSLAYQQTAVAAARMLKRAGAEVVLQRGLGCCGMPFRSMGDEDTAASLLRRSLSTLADGDPGAIVTVCASCAIMLREGMTGDYEASGGTLIPVLDIHEFLAETGVPALHPASGPALRITWHDPCHLKLGLGVTQAPREIITGLSGVEYAEAPESSCCGGGGVFSLSHYELALKIGLSRAEELTATGAGTIVTGCPGCRMQLEDMLSRLGSKTVVLHTVELLDSMFSAAAV